MPKEQLPLRLSKRIVLMPAVSTVKTYQVRLQPRSSKEDRFRRTDGITFVSQTPSKKSSHKHQSDINQRLSFRNEPVIRRKEM